MQRAEQAGPGMEMYSSSGKHKGFRPYLGEVDSETYKMKNWQVVDESANQTTYSFFHTSKADLDNLEIVDKSAITEMGSGFYTTVGTELRGAQEIGTHWYAKADAKWKIFRFGVSDGTIQKLITGSATVVRDIEFFLTNGSGYPPDYGGMSDSQIISRLDDIAAQGNIIVFPDKKDLQVTAKGGTKVSIDELNISHGSLALYNYFIAIGPQKPDQLSTRQIVFLNPKGQWLINSASRSVAGSGKGATAY